MKHDQKKNPKRNEITLKLKSYINISSTMISNKSTKFELVKKQM